MIQLTMIQLLSHFKAFDTSLLCSSTAFNQNIVKKRNIVEYNYNEKNNFSIFNIF